MAGFEIIQLTKNFRSEGKNMFEPVRLCAQNDKNKWETTNLILTWYVLVHRYEDVEFARINNETQQLPLLILAHPACGTVVTSWPTSFFAKSFGRHSSRRMRI
jgi:hypothetical protein